MAVFHKLCRIARSSRAHRTESVSVMGHTRSAAVCSTKWDQKQRNIVVHISFVLERGTARSPCVAERRWLGLTDVDTGVHISARWVGASSCNPSLCNIYCYAGPKRDCVLARYFVEIRKCSRYRMTLYDNCLRVSARVCRFQWQTAWKFLRQIVWVSPLLTVQLH